MSHGKPGKPKKYPYPSSLIHFQQKNPFLKLWPIGDLRQISAPCQILEPWHFWPLNMGCTRLRSVGGFLFWGWIGYLKVGRLWILPEVGIGFLSLLEVWKVIVIHEPKERWNQDWCFTPGMFVAIVFMRVDWIPSWPLKSRFRRLSPLYLLALAVSPMLEPTRRAASRPKDLVRKRCACNYNNAIALVPQRQLSPWERIELAVAGSSLFSRWSHSVREFSSEPKAEGVWDEPVYSVTVSVTGCFRVSVLWANRHGHTAKIPHDYRHDNPDLPMWWNKQ